MIFAPPSLHPKSHYNYFRPIRPPRLRPCSIRLSSHHPTLSQRCWHHLRHPSVLRERGILGINARRQRADELGGLDHCPPQTVIGVVDFEGTIAYGAGATLAGEANCLCAKISYGSASFRVGRRCGLLVLLLEIPTAANCRFAMISYGAVVPRPGHFGLQGLLLGLELLGEIPG